jgi:cytochrome c
MVERLARLKASVTPTQNKNSGITWNEETFKEYIKDPRAKVPGTKMIFAGIKSDKELTDVWGYLKQFAANGSKK